MKPQNKRPSPKIRKLRETVLALRMGAEQCVSITRLTSLKSMCKDPETAARFTFYLAECTYQQLREECPKFTTETDWQHYLALIEEALGLMRAHLAAPSSETHDALIAIKHRVREVQTYVRLLPGRPISRMINSRHALIIEHALNSMLDLNNCGDYAYQTARKYAERFDSRCGPGLILESAPFLEDIIRFWE